MKQTVKTIIAVVPWVVIAAVCASIFIPGCARTKKQIDIPDQYSGACVFSEGLAAVQQNGNIGFIDRNGNVVIDFKYPCHGNPLSGFVFEGGHCVVADSTGHCGVIDRSGKWIILPEYDNVSAFAEYAIASRTGVKLQVGYDGTIINDFVLDDLEELTYSEEERYIDRYGDVCYTDRDVKTGYFSYTIGGRCGLMDGKTLIRLTEPIYKDIRAVRGDIFRAKLLDDCSEVILNDKGEVVK